MKTHLTILAGVLLNCTLSIAQNGLTLHLDTTALNGYNISEAVPTADGGSVLILMEEGGANLWKCDAAGIAIWRNSYSSSTPVFNLDLATCLNGDVLLAGATGSMTGPDRLQPAYDVWRIDADGEVVWHKHYSEEPIAFTSGPSYHSISVMEDATGMIHLLSLTDQQRVVVTKLESNGDLLWSEQIGDPGMQMLYPCVDCAATTWLHPDATGGCRITLASGSNSSERTEIVSLATDGSLEWVSAFSYLGLPSSAATFPHVVDDAGNTILQWTSTSANGGMHLAYIAESGGLAKVDRYGINSNCCAELDHDGGRLFVRFYDAVFTVDDDGAIVTASDLGPLPSDATYSYTLPSSNFEVLDGRVVLSSAYSAYPLTAALPWGAPGLRAFLMDGPSDICFGEPFTTAHDVLPNSIFNTTAVEGLLAMPHATNVAEVPTTVLPKPLLPSINICSTTAAIAETTTTATYRINNSILDGSMSLIVASDDPIRWDVIDGNGRLLRTEGQATRQFVLTPGSLAAGAYTLMGHDALGVPVKPARFVVVD